MANISWWKRTSVTERHSPVPGTHAYSALFLAEDAALIGITKNRALDGVLVRLTLEDPNSPSVALRGKEEGIGDSAAAKIRNALTLYRTALAVESVEIRLHDTVLYNSLYRVDDRLFVNQHTFGSLAAHSPVFCYRGSESSDIAAAYLDGFKRVWMSAKSI